MKAKTPIGLLSALALTALAAGGNADSATENAFEAAIAAGAERLTADDIAERLIGKTVTFAPAANDARYLVYYGLGNEAMSRKVGDETVNTGFHAVTNRDQVCIGWDGSDLPRLRCVDVLMVDGVIHKYKADGTLSGRIEALADGNAT